MPTSVAMILEKLESKFESTFHPANVVAGVCGSPSVDQVRDLLAHAEELTKKARYTTDFAKSSQVLGDAGDKLNGAVKAIDEVTSKSSGIAADASAACDISNAIATLNKWNMPNSGTSPQEAARAFDRLFGGAARFMGKLPPPANLYAPVLSSISKYNFFSNMQSLLDPENPNTPSGRALRDAMSQ